MFNHVDIDLPKLERETVDGIRYYKIPENGEFQSQVIRIGNFLQIGVKELVKKKQTK